MGTLSTAGTISAAPTNNRVIHALNGNLYFTSASAAGSGLWRIKGQPFNTVKPDTPALFISTGASSSSPYGFSINAGETVAYIADDRTTSANVGGIYRWTLSGGVWTATDTLKPGTTTAGGARGVAVDWSGTYPVVYATTTDNRLIRWVDSNNFSHIYTVLATAGTNTVFRSVALSPRAATCPATTAASISPAGALGYCAGDTIRLRTNKTPGLNYLWTLNGVAIPSAATTDSVIRVAASGYYNVIINRNINCLDSAGGSAVVFSPKPNNQITLTTNDSVCAGDTIRLHAISGGGLSFNWLNIPSGVFYQLHDSNLIIQGNTAMVSPIRFSVISIVTAGGTPGCRDTEAVTLTIMPLPQPIITYNAGILSVPGGFVSYKWYLNSNPVIGATTSAYIPTSNGAYSVVVADSLGCVGGNSFNVTGITPASINGRLAQAGIRLHPNPVMDILHIDAQSPVSITLRDMLGRTLLQKAGVTELSLKGLPAGLFSITLYDDRGALIGTQLLRKAE